MLTRPLVPVLSHNTGRGGRVGRIVRSAADSKIIVAVVEAATHARVLHVSLVFAGWCAFAPEPPAFFTIVWSTSSDPVHRASATVPNPDAYTAAGTCAVPQYTYFVRLAPLLATVRRSDGYGARNRDLLFNYDIINKCADIWACHTAIANKPEGDPHLRLAEHRCERHRL